MNARGWIRVSPPEIISNLLRFGKVVSSSLRDDERNVRVSNFHISNVVVASTRKVGSSKNDGQVFIIKDRQSNNPTHIWEWRLTAYYKIAEHIRILRV